MIRYSYNQQVQPPAPFIYVAWIALDQTARADRVPMLIDSGADLTVIPQRLIAELNLIKFSKVGVVGFRESPEPEDTYLVSLKIHDWEIEAVEVIAGDDGYGLLGRDVINHFLVTLDGPNLALTLQRKE